ATRRSEAARERLAPHLRARALPVQRSEALQELMVVAHTPSCRPRGGSPAWVRRVTGAARLAHLQSLDRRSIFLASNLSAVSKPASRSSPSLRICSTTSASGFAVGEAVGSGAAAAGGGGRIVRSRAPAPTVGEATPRTPRRSILRSLFSMVTGSGSPGLLGVGPGRIGRAA